MGSHKHHEIERAQDSEPMLLPMPLLRSADPPTRQPPKPYLLRSGRPVSKHRKVRQGRHPKKRQASDGQSQQDERIRDLRHVRRHPQVAVEPQRPTPVLHAGQRPCDRYVDDEAHDANETEQLGDAGYRTPPVCLCDPRRNRRHRRPLSGREDEREQRRSISPCRRVPETLPRNEHDQANDPKRGEYRENDGRVPERRAAQPAPGEQVVLDRFGRR